MKPEEKAALKSDEREAQSGPTSMRTGKTISGTGVWMSRCMREGCLFVERLHLRQGAPAPPCRRCLNAAWLRLLYTISPEELPAQPAPPAAAPAAIGVPTESVHSARGAAAAEASASIQKEKPAAPPGWVGDRSWGGQLEAETLLIISPDEKAVPAAAPAVVDDKP